MPELPEVETVRNTLKPLILGKEILSVHITVPRIIQNISSEEFVNALRGQKFLDIKRKGKYLLFELTNLYMIVHLRMEGKFFMKTPLQAVEKHEHVVFLLDSGEQLRYHDTRKFGTMEIVRTKDYETLLESRSLAKLGPEPIDGDLQDQRIYTQILQSNRPIKSILLDQRVLAGLGNIYADEACYLAGVLPEKKGVSLSKEEISRIILGSKAVLEKAIALGGTTIHSFGSNGISGKFQNQLRVHTKKSCEVCQNDIQKKKIGGRTTYFCSICQK